MKELGDCCLRFTFVVHLPVPLNLTAFTIIWSALHSDKGCPTQIRHLSHNTKHSGYILALVRYNNYEYYEICDGTVECQIDGTEV